MSDNLENIKRKIAAMIMKANDTSVTEAEAEAFNAKAHELMAKYNIARSELEKDEEAVRNHMTFRVQLRPWSNMVIAGITKLYYCKYFSRKLDAKGRQHEITLIGEVQNLGMCHAICVMVLRSITTAARQSGDGRSFMTGAGSAVWRRCQEMYDAAHLPSGDGPPEQRAASASSANALVAIEVKERSGNDQYVAEVMGLKLQVGRASKPKVTSSEGYHRGVRHGNAVQLRRNLLA
jgi:hypothetical protein